MKMYADVTNDEIDEVYKKISANVKRIRKEKGITQTELALCMGFSTATFYTNAENFNEKHFNLEHIIKISKILGVDMCEFLK